MQVIIDSIQYETQPETFLCDGCIAKHDLQVCHKLISLYPCDTNKVIFIKKEAKEEIFTRIEVIDIAKEFYGDDDFMTDELINAFDEYSKKRKFQNDPEYLKYLELREKFE